MSWLERTTQTVFNGSQTANPTRRGGNMNPIPDSAIVELQRRKVEGEVSRTDLAQPSCGLPPAVFRCCRRSRATSRRAPLRGMDNQNLK
jgi:hypothetical protein